MPLNLCVKKQNPSKGKSDRKPFNFAKKKITYLRKDITENYHAYENEFLDDDAAKI